MDEEPLDELELVLDEAAPDELVLEDVEPDEVLDDATLLSEEELPPPQPVIINAKPIARIGAPRRFIRASLPLFVFVFDHSGWALFA